MLFLLIGSCSNLFTSEDLLVMEEPACNVVKKYFKGRKLSALSDLESADFCSAKTNTFLKEIEEELEPLNTKDKFEAHLLQQTQINEVELAKVNEKILDIPESKRTKANSDYQSHKKLRDSLRSFGIKEFLYKDFAKRETFTKEEFKKYEETRKNECETMSKQKKAIVGEEKDEKAYKFNYIPDNVCKEPLIELKKYCDSGKGNTGKTSIYQPKSNFVQELKKRRAEVIGYVCTIDTSVNELKKTFVKDYIPGNTNPKEITLHHIIPKAHMYKFITNRLVTELLTLKNDEELTKIIDEARKFLTQGTTSGWMVEIFDAGTQNFGILVSKAIGYALWNPANLAPGPKSDQRKSDPHTGHSKEKQYTINEEIDEDAKKIYQKSEELMNASTKIVEIVENAQPLSAFIEQHRKLAEAGFQTLYNSVGFIKAAFKWTLDQGKYSFADPNNRRRKRKLLLKK